MPKPSIERLPVRSRVAMVLVKGGLALGAIWVLGLFALAARTVLSYF